MDTENKKCVVADLWRKHPPSTYSDKDIFNLLFRTQEDVENFLLEEFFDAASIKELGRKKATLTRRKNVVWKRIAPVVKKVCGDGGKGVYKIERGFSSFIITYLFANDYEEANELAGIFLKHILAPHYRFQITFMEFGDVTSVTKYNNRLLKSLDKQLESCETRQEYVKNQSARLLATIHAVETIQEHQLKVYISQ
jgi:hypothetical protein